MKTKLCDINPAAAEKELRKVQELHENSEESLVGKMPASQPPSNPPELK